MKLPGLKKFTVWGAMYIKITMTDVSRVITNRAKHRELWQHETGGPLSLGIAQTNFFRRAQSPRMSES